LTRSAIAGGLTFECNPLGVQDDAIYSEDSDSADEGFDTVWTSRGQITAGGYVVLMSIPFKSLRFSHERSQTWNIALWRNLGRRSEVSWWPRVSSQYRGFLSQASSIAGIENISPGRNLQFDPYVSTRAFHSVDGRDPDRRVWIGRSEVLGVLTQRRSSRTAWSSISRSGLTSARSNRTSRKSLRINGTSCSIRRSDRFSRRTRATSMCRWLSQPALAVHAPDCRT